MALQNFVDNNLPTIKAAWLNAVDLIQNVVTGSAGGIAVTGTISAAATNGSGILALSSSTGTNGVTETFTNTGGTYTIGVDNSVGDIFGSVYSFGLNIPTSRTFDVNVNNTQVMRVSSAGIAVTGTTSTTTGMAVGGATAGAGGIAFPATAVAVADVNTLDDYEEGTFTPAISAGAGSITASSATGSYTKIGNRVFYEVVLTITTNGTGATSLIFTLPFTAAQQHTPVGVNTSSAETCVGISTTTDVGLRTYSGLYPVGSGGVLRVSGNYIV